MKIKKTMTAAATAANRDNSKKSTGPKTERGKSVACRNSVRHGILAKKLGFQNPAKRAEYEEIWQWWTKYFRPRGPLEEYLVQEITNTVWKLRLTETLEMKELSQRQRKRLCAQSWRTGPTFRMSRCSNVCATARSGCVCCASKCFGKTSRAGSKNRSIKRSGS